MKVYINLFNKLITPENLFNAWEDFRRDKKNKEDVLLFEKNLENEIFKLHRELSSETYRHSGYVDFYISDPKHRHIHKAIVRDRVLHHAIMNILYPYYDKVFIHNSFSCRIGKGNHKGVEALRSMVQKESNNDTRQVFVLKCDIEKFFDSIDHDILIKILKTRIKDGKLMNLLVEVIESFVSDRSTLFERRGVPIGNLTSQLFANIYMDTMDQYMKHELKVKHYARYTDDFVIVSKDKKYLTSLIPNIKKFLNTELKLGLHPGKVTIRKYTQGVDFLGYVVLPHYTKVRKRTVKRISRRIKEKIILYKSGKLKKEKLDATFMSYLGVLSHADTYGFSEKLKNDYFLSVSNSD
jgi:RNA-directed DNA polymerase